MPKEKEFKVQVEALSGIDRACDLVRKFRTGATDVATVGAALAELSAEQLQVTAFCLRAAIGDLRALRDAGKG